MGAPEGNKNAAQKTKRILARLDMRRLLSLVMGDFGDFADMADAERVYWQYRYDVVRGFLERGEAPPVASETFDAKLTPEITDYWLGRDLPVGHVQALERVRRRVGEAKPFGELLWEELGEPADYFAVHPEEVQR